MADTQTAVVMWSGIAQAVAAIVSIGVATWALVLPRYQRTAERLEMLISYRNIAHYVTRFVPGECDRIRAGEDRSYRSREFAVCLEELRKLDFGNVSPVHFSEAFVNFAVHGELLAEILDESQRSTLLTPAVLQRLANMESDFARHQGELDRYLLGRWRVRKTRDGLIYRKTVREFFLRIDQ